MHQEETGGHQAANFTPPAVGQKQSRAAAAWESQGECDGAEAGTKSAAGRDWPYSQVRK